MDQLQNWVAGNIHFYTNSIISGDNFNTLVIQLKCEG